MTSLGLLLTLVKSCFFFFFWELLEYNVAQSLPQHVSFNFKVNI